MFKTKLEKRIGELEEIINKQHCIVKDFYSFLEIEGFFLNCKTEAKDVIKYVYKVTKKK